MSTHQFYNMIRLKAYMFNPIKLGTVQRLIISFILYLEPHSLKCLSCRHLLEFLQTCSKQQNKKPLFPFSLSQELTRPKLKGGREVEPHRIHLLRPEKCRETLNLHKENRNSQITSYIPFSFRLSSVHHVIHTSKMKPRKPQFLSSSSRNKGKKRDNGQQS